MFDVISGKILSARSYSAGGNMNYNVSIKSMTLSTGLSPMGYVLSNYQTGAFSCTG